jgi:hypothetical protein
MTPFLVAISWADPEEVAAYKRVGLDDDPRCSTGIFILANNPEEALSWAKRVANQYLDYLFKSQHEGQALEVFCWVKNDPEQSSWKHCLGFFQTVSVGQYPEFQGMTSDAYSDWCKKVGLS